MYTDLFPSKYDLVLFFQNKSVTELIFLKGH